MRSADEIVAGIGDGAIDVGIVRCPPSAAGVESWLLRLEPQGVLVPDSHPLAHRDEAALDDLRGETVLLHHRSANPGHYDAILAMLERAGIEPRVECATSASTFSTRRCSRAAPSRSSASRHG